MVLYFITGNKNKFEEVRAILPEVEQLELDLPEIQELDPQVIIRDKLEGARRRQGDLEFLVEDTSLYLEGLKGLPGPLIKWFLKALECDGLYKLAESLGNDRAKAQSYVGYSNKGEIYLFEGTVEGKIVAPKGKYDFGWGPVFQPKGYTKTFGEMLWEEKDKVNMRSIALNKLKVFLSTT